MNGHLDPERLGALADDALDARDRLAAERHLEQCDRCRDALAELTALDRGLAGALAHDPGEEYFERFAARVEDRIRAHGERVPVLPEGAGGRFDLAQWFRSPRRLALIGTVATLIGGAAIVLVAVRGPDEWLRKPTDAVVREGQPAPAPGATGPAESRLESDADERAAAPSTPGATTMRAPAGGGAADRAAGASPQRLREVRRNELGEDVPVVTEQESRFAREPQTTPAPPPAPGEPVRVTKPRLAQPLATARDEAAQKSAPPASLEAPQAATGTAQAGESQLTGRVVDPQGRPVAGAEVMLVEHATVAKTAADGTFAMHAPPGTYRLSVLAVGFRPATTTLTVEPDGSTTRVVLQAVSVLGATAYRTSDPFAVLSSALRNLARAANASTAQARETPSAAAWERAATAWQRVVARVSREPARTEAVWRLAEARFEAWRLEPTGARADAARETLRQFLVTAPPGDRRDQAGRWLEQLE